MPSPIDTEAAVARLMRFLAVEGTTGNEALIAHEIQSALIEVGVPADAIRYDDAHTRIPLPTQTGNLIVTLPGTKPGPRLLFMTHMDTVPLCAGAVPVREGERIIPKGVTALGGDDRTGCGAVVTLIAELIRQKLDYPPLTLLFTVREESGLFGARHLDPAELGGPVMGFNIDGSIATDITIGATGAERWEVEVFGKASHAGVYPDKGISASAVVALALAEVFNGGWFGKVRKDGKEGTSNVGSIGDANGRSAGEATNVVTDFVHVTGESRSHDATFVREITTAYERAFESAAKRVTDKDGHPATVKFMARQDYHAFKLDDDAPVVQRAVAVVKSLSKEPRLKISNGGLDANWVVLHGVPTITFGAGQNEIHTVKEYVEIKDYLAGCELALALATN